MKFRDLPQSPIILTFTLMLPLILAGCGSNSISPAPSNNYYIVDSYDVELAKIMKNEMAENLEAGNITYTETSNGTIRYLRGAIDSPVNSPEDAVAAVAAVGDMFGVEDIHYRVKKVSGHSRNESVYSMRQLYDGIPVSSGWFEVTVAEDGAVSEIDGCYVNVIPENNASALAPNPTITAEEALAHSDVSNIEDPTNCELYIYTYPDGKWRLAWYISSDRGSFAFLDAHDGSLLDRTQSLFY